MITMVTAVIASALKKIFRSRGMAAGFAARNVQPHASQYGASGYDTVLQSGHCFSIDDFSK